MSEEAQPEKSKAPKGRPSKLAVALEDALILVSIGSLFLLTVFHRHRPTAQWALGFVLAVMLVLLVVRARRVRRAFRE